MVGAPDAFHKAGEGVLEGAGEEGLQEDGLGQLAGPPAGGVALLFPVTGGAMGGKRAPGGAVGQDEEEVVLEGQ